MICRPTIPEMVAVVWLQRDSTNRLQGQGTRDYGCSLLECDKYDVTYWCMLENITPFHSFCHIFFASSFFLWHTNTRTDRNRHKYKKNPKTVAFSLSPSECQTQKHKDTQTERRSYSLLHEHAHTHTSLNSPCGCHQKQPLCPTLCKSNSLLLFSLVYVFSFPPHSLLLSSEVPSSHSTSSHLSNTSPAT